MLIASLIIICSGCCKQTIVKGTTLYKVENPNTAELSLCKSTETTAADVKIKDDHAIIKVHDETKLSTQGGKFNYPGPWKGWLSMLPKDTYFYFPLEGSNVSPLKKKLFYTEGKKVLQTMSVPIKIRPKLTEPNLIDSFPSQTSTSFNLGLAFGWKMQRVSFQSQEYSSGKYSKTLSFTPIVFLGLGAQELNNNNTRDPRFLISQKVPSISPGFMLLFGIDRFNIGYGIGWDIPISNNNSSWVYHGEYWHGIAVSLDLIK